eukprot:scaffold100396_cov33-Tisochrysis_lutea.AAC.9
MYQKKWFTYSVMMIFWFITRGENTSIEGPAMPSAHLFPKAPTCISSVVDMRRAQFRKSVSDTAYDSERPAIPAATAAAPPVIPGPPVAAPCSPTASAATPAMIELPIASSRMESQRLAAADAKPTLRFSSSLCLASSAKRSEAPKAMIVVAPCNVSVNAA